MQCSLSRNGFDSINITKLDVFWLSNLSRYEGTEPLTFDILWPEEWAYMKLYEVCLCLLCFDRCLWCVWWLSAFDELGSYSCGQRRHPKARYHLVLSKVMDSGCSAQIYGKKYSMTNFKRVYTWALYPDANLIFKFQSCQTFDDINLCQFSRMMGDDWGWNPLPQVLTGLKQLRVAIAYRNSRMTEAHGRWLQSCCAGEGFFLFGNWFPVDINIAATLQVCMIDICTYRNSYIY